MLLKLRLFLLYTFPIVLFCSYYPLIPIVSTSSTNYELSLPLLWLLIFSVLALKDFATFSLNLYKKKPLYLLLFSFPLYLTITSIWSANPVRAFLTSGILWCLIITSIVAFTTFRQKKLLDPRRFLKIFFISSCVFCFVCWLQSILDVVGIDRSTTLLCSGCVSRMFGFPHPSGLAIEPQFMGNLLLAPTLIAIFLWTRKKPCPSSPFTRRTLLALSFLFLSTLLLTFSRGAIYSFLLGLAFLLIANLFRLKNRRILLSLPLVLVSAVFIILSQGVFSALSYADSTFLGGIEKSVSQMTLGKIKLHLEPQSPTGTDTTEPETTSTAEMTSDSSVPVFDGYVEESTNARMKFNNIALELAPKTPLTFLFGYGLGSAGETMFKEGKTDTAYEIIQNEPLSLLFETGLVGLLLAITSVAMVLLIARKYYLLPERYFLFSLCLASGFSLLFFSGLPNALHLYLFPSLLMASLPRAPRPSSRKSSSPRA